MSILRIPRSPWSSGWAVAAGLVLAGCEAPPPPTPEPVERPFAEVFALQSRVRLQPSEDDPIAGPRALVRWGDHVVVVDAMQSNLKLFAPSGRLVRTIGRAGNGPGEFLAPSAATVLPDGSLAVLDGPGLLVSRFSPAGEYRSRWPVEGFAPTGLASLPDGRLLVGAQSRAGKKATDPRLRIYSADGVLQQSFAPIIADGALETRFQQVFPTLVGHTALAASDSRPTIRFRDLRSGEDRVVEFGGGLIQRPAWDRLDRDGTPSTFLKWSNEQNWVSKILPLDSTRFLMMVRGPMENGEPRLRYVVGDLDGKTLAVTRPVPIGLLHAEGGAIYGLEMKGDGEFDLLTFQLRLPLSSAGSTAEQRTASR